MNPTATPNPNPAATPSHHNLALVIAQGVSCAKLRQMARTGIDANFPQQFALHIYRYNYRGERVAYTNGQGCLLWIKIQSLGILPQGVYVHGEIFKAHHAIAQTCDVVYGGILSRHRGHPAVRLLRPGVQIQFVHRGALTDGPVFQLSDPQTGESYSPYIPEQLDTYTDSDLQSLLTSMIPLSQFVPKVAAM